MDWHRMLAVQIVDDILSAADLPAYRIALMERFDDGSERNIGGLCRDALINCIEQSLKGGE